MNTITQNTTCTTTALTFIQYLLCQAPLFFILGIGRTSAYLLVKEEHFSSIPLPAGSHEYCGV